LVSPSSSFTPILKKTIRKHTFPSFEWVSKFIYSEIQKNTKTWDLNNKKTKDVTELLQDWPEKSERQRKSVSVDDALYLLHEKESIVLHKFVHFP
jgi:hypothetical protein